MQKQVQAQQQVQVQVQLQVQLRVKVRVRVKAVTIKIALARSSTNTSAIADALEVELRPIWYSLTVRNETKGSSGLLKRDTGSARRACPVRAAKCAPARFCYTSNEILTFSISRLQKYQKTTRILTTFWCAVGTRFRNFNMAHGFSLLFERAEI